MAYIKACFIQREIHMNDVCIEIDCNRSVDIDRTY